MKKPKKGTAAAIISSFVVGVGATLIVDKIILPRFSHAERRVSREVHAGQWQLINPLISCANLPDGISPKEAPLEKQVRKVIAEHNVKNPIDEISVFYRDLNNGPTMEIDSDRQFIAASLMKVPVAIMYLRKAEQNPQIMQQQFEFHPGYAMPDHVQTVDPPPPLVVGNKYTVEDLMSRMLILSDNSSAAVLINESRDVDIVKTLQDMGIPMTIVAGSDASIAVEDYASMFRILYNATYLDKASSNYLLDVLTRSAHRGGLREGVDPKVRIASKFGEYRIGTVQQYHECGIVYYPERPYILCVMTRGGEVKDLFSAIKSVSSAVFEFVSTNTKKKK